MEPFFVICSVFSGYTWWWARTAHISIRSSKSVWRVWQFTHLRQTVQLNWVWSWTEKKDGSHSFHFKTPFLIGTVCENLIQFHHPSCSELRIWNIRYNACWEPEASSDCTKHKCPQIVQHLCACRSGESPKQCNLKEELGWSYGNHDW